MVTSLKTGDSMLLYTETDTQYQHMIGVLILDPSTAPNGFDVDTLMDVSESMVMDAPGYRMKLVDSPLTLDVPMLAEDPDFKLRNHIFHVAAPEPGGREQLEELVADIASRPLVRSRPLWENWIVTGLEDGNIAMISKTHHCLQDGVGGVEVMAKMFDLEPDPPAKEDSKAVTEGSKVRPPAALDILREAYRVNRERPGVLTTANKAVRTLLQRRKASSEFSDKSLLAPEMSDAPRLFFNGQISAYRSVALGSLQLEDIKSLKNAYGVTLNDMILSVVAIALRRYLLEHDDLPEEALACSVPVSLALNTSDDRESDEGNNQVSMMNVRFPVQIEDTAELVRSINQCAVAAKDMFAQSGEEISRTIIAGLPPRVAAGGLRVLSGAMMARNPLGNLGVSNIPGPPFPLYMRGAKVVANYPIGPVPNGVGLGITLMSYVDRIDFSLQGCRERMPDIQRLAELMDEAVEELLAASPEPEKPRAKGRRKPATRKAAPRKRAKRKAGSAKKGD